MRFSVLFSSVAVAASLSSAQTIRRECGSTPSAEVVAASEQRFNDNVVASILSQDTFSDQVIDVHFHVVHSGDALNQGFVPDSQVAEQIAVLNNDFRDTGLSFNLVNTTRTLSPEWFINATFFSEEQDAMKRELRVGGPKELNVWSVGFGGEDWGGLLGYATFPSDYEAFPWDDGIVVLYSSLPGGTTVPFDRGQTVTHEVGHWVGLYHVFQGECDDEGDIVEDTPPQFWPTIGCPESQDSCPNPGLDSIHNFMDYSDDICMTEFTPGQVVRMRAQIATFRGIEA